MKLRLLAAATAALLLAAGSAAAQDTSTEKGKLSYALGYQTGADLAQLTARGEALDVNAVVEGLQDAYAKKQPAVPGEQLKAAVEAMQKRLAEKAKAEFDRMAAENKTKSDAFLAQNKGKAGVKIGALAGNTGVELGTETATQLGQGWTQAQAAQRFGIAQSRVSDLVRGKWDKFSLDMLITLAARAGQKVVLEMHA